MLTMVNSIDFGGHSLKVKVMMGIIDKCGVRGDATLCVVIFKLEYFHVSIVIFVCDNLFCIHSSRSLSFLL